MQVTIIIFGQLTDITGNPNMVLTDVADTDQIVAKMSAMYPAISNTKFMIAVDKQVVTENTILKNNSIVALLPPFSGG